MSRIRILPDRVANQIAAGEVIERPAAVVKELLENSLDAGAGRIDVDFRHGGRALIRVEDDGEGMSRDDALLALERHATSKILEAADLNDVRTFGFRGEALPSIASVSRFELQTRTKDEESGTEILVNGGKFVHVRDCGRPVGTRITVEHLFNSVPARRKFLRTDATESAHIVQCARLYAVAQPEVALTLSEGGRVIFQSGSCGDLRQRVGEVIGRSMLDGLTEVSAEGGNYALRGLVGKPGVSRSSRHEMVFFINRRPVDSRTLAYALIDAHQQVLPKGRYPVCFLFLDVPPGSVDVNVHPAKREVRFRREAEVRGFVVQTLMKVFSEHSPARSSRPGQPAPGRVQPSFAAHVRKPENVSPPVYAAPSAAAAPRKAHPVETSSVSHSGQGGCATLDWKYLARLHDNWALFETRAGLVVLDWRAAAERIWYERLTGEFEQGQTSSQRLLFAIPLELDPVSAALLKDRLDFLVRHGFGIEEFGRNFFRIESVPAWMDPDRAEGFIRDLTGLMRDGQLDDRAEGPAREALARAAAARAIRLDPPAGAGEMEELAGRLFATRHPWTSPAGKATHFELTAGEISRRFQK